MNEVSDFLSLLNCIQIKCFKIAEKLLNMMYSVNIMQTNSAFTEYFENAWNLSTELGLI